MLSIISGALYTARTDFRDFPPIKKNRDPSVARVLGFISSGFPQGTHVTYLKHKTSRTNRFWRAHNECISWYHFTFRPQILNMVIHFGRAGVKYDCLGWKWFTPVYFLPNKPTHDKIAQHLLTQPPSWKCDVYKLLHRITENWIFRKMSILTLAKNDFLGSATTSTVHIPKVHPLIS